MDVLNDDVLTLILEYLYDSEYDTNKSYKNGKLDIKPFIIIELYFLKFVSKRFYHLLKTMNRNNGLGKNSHIIEKYFVQITKMNKPHLFKELKNYAIPINAFMKIMFYACENDYVDIVRYFHENKVKGVEGNVFVYFYFSPKVKKQLLDISTAFNSQNVIKFLSNIYCFQSKKDKMYDLLIDVSNCEEVLDYASLSVEDYKHLMIIGDV